jgi:mono/diheme cytochrome c family protein
VVVFVAFTEPARMEAQTGNWEGRSIEKGAEIFANNCYTCHGDHGQGGAGPALNSKHFFTERLTEIGFTGTLEDYVKLTVAAGRPSNVHGQWSVIMPTWSSSYGGPFRNDQVQQVTDYVLNWGPTAILQTDEEDPWIAFNNIPVSSTATVSGTETVTGTATSGDMASSEPRSPEVLFGVPPEGLGCVACHNPNLPEDADNRGLIGPNLGNLADHAGTRVPGEDAQTYVHQSIAAPGAFVVPTYPAGVMPQGLDTRMTPEEFDSLVNWLLDPSRVAQ